MKSPVALLVLLLIVFAPPPPAADALPLFDGLGSYSRTIATASPEAQRYSDQELAFMYAFNHDEAIRACTRAAELDPDCAMAHWGVAIANGPHINNTAVPPERAAAAAALGRARAASAGASAVERALIEALDRRAARAADRVREIVADIRIKSPCLCLPGVQRGSRVRHRGAHSFDARLH